MRLALIIASDYRHSSQVPTLARSLEDAERFAAFLEGHDPDIAIEEFTADRTFPEQFEQALREQSEKPDSLIVYFSGSIVTASGRDPSLLLDGERLGAFALPRLRRMLEEHAPNSLVVIDAAAVIRDAAALDDVVEAVGMALGRRGSVSSLVNVSEPESLADASSSFTDLLLFCWDTALSADDSEESLPVSELFELMQGEPGSFDFPLARCFVGQLDFDMLGGARESELAEQEVSGLRLADHERPDRGQANGNGKQSSGAMALPLPASAMPPPELPRHGGGNAGGVGLTMPAAALPGPLLPLPEPGLVARAPAGRGAPAPPSLAQPMRAEARGKQELPRLREGARAEALLPLGKKTLRGTGPLGPLQPVEKEIEEELTEPGETFGAIADEATVETPPGAAPDTEREAPGPLPELAMLTEAEALALGGDGGFAEGEDTEVTEGFGPVSALVNQARIANHGVDSEGELSAPTPLSELLSSVQGDVARIVDPDSALDAGPDETPLSDLMSSLAGGERALEQEPPLPSELTNALEADFDGDEAADAEPVSSEPMPAFSRESEPADDESIADEPMPSFPLDDDEDASYAGESPGRLPVFRESAPDSAPETFASQPIPSFPMESQDSIPEALEPPSNSEPMPSFELEEDDEPAEDAFGELLAAIPPPAVLAAPSGAPRSPLPPPPLPLPGGVGAPMAGSSAEPALGLEPRAVAEQPSEPPPYEVCLASGDERLEARDFTAAVTEYEKALLHAPADQAGVVYGRLGAVCRARGDYDGAVTNYEIALELLPGDPEPLSALTELSMAQCEYAAVEGYQRRYLEVQHDPTARATVWDTLSKLWSEHDHDVVRHRAILAEWMQDLPDDLEPHRRLIISHEAQREYEEAIEARRRLARLSADPRELLTALREIHAHLRDADYAAQVSLEALQADPSAQDAVELGAALLSREERWEDLARFYEQVASLVLDPSLHAEIGSKLGALYCDKLGAPERTISAYERVLEEDPGRVDVRRQLVDLYTTRSEFELALLHCRRALKAASGDHALYHKVYALLDKVGASDAAWNAAVVLECLGEADINVQLVADAHRPNGLLAAQDTVPEDFWAHGLFTPERDKQLSELMAAVAEVAIEVRASFLKRKKRVPKLVPEARHDPQTSTTTLAKSLLWTAKLLSIKPPQLYVMDEVPDDLCAAPLETPTALASKSLARGLSLSQLAFLWGRHLTLFRPEHYLAVFFSSAQELSPLLAASLLAGECPQLDGKALDAEAKRLAKHLKKRLHPGSFERLRAASRSFEQRGLEDRARAWLRTVALAGGRAGLLACGDVSIACELTRKHPLPGLVTQQEQLDDILCFSVSDEYAKLRERLGVAIA